MVEYGFTSNPPDGSDAICLSMAGDRNNTVVIATNHQSYRMKNLGSGEVAIYDLHGQSVYLTATGIIVNGAGLPIKVTNTSAITLDSPLVTCTGQLVANTSVTSPMVAGTTDVTFAGKSAVNHRHSDPQGGTTGVPA
jgi:phage baseplate assembly protein V